MIVIHRIEKKTHKGVYKREKSAFVMKKIAIIAKYKQFKLTSGVEYGEK